MARNRAWMLASMVILALSGLSQSALAQYVSYFSHGDQPAGVTRAGGPVWGSAMAVPAGYYPNQLAGHAMPEPMAQAGFEDGSPYEDFGDGSLGYDNCDACESCGGGGCSSCAMGGAFGGPYEDGACGPRWYDISAEFYFLTRDNAGRNIDFASDGIDGPRVLSSGDLEYQEEPGYRVTARYDLGAASNLEAGYLGGFFWRSTAQATSGINDLYSVMSDFGLTPPTGFVETDQTYLQRLTYDTQLDSAEFNYRHQWVSPGLRLQGSWLVGFRYTLLDESFGYETYADAHTDQVNGGPRGPGFMNYHTGATNNLFGVQVGGDAYGCLLPGLTVGGELKAGGYVNHARQHTNITATSVVGSLEEDARSDDIAMIAEAGLIAVYQVAPGWSFRAGYQFIYFDGVALASENFNSNAEFLGGATPRVVTINENGAAFFHGYTAGVEWLW